MKRKGTRSRSSSSSGSPTRKNKKAKPSPKTPPLFYFIQIRNINGHILWGGLASDYHNPKEVSFGYDYIQDFISKDSGIDEIDAMDKRNKLYIFDVVKEGRGNAYRVYSVSKVQNDKVVEIVPESVITMNDPFYGMK